MSRRKSDLGRQPQSKIEYKEEYTRDYDRESVIPEATETYSITAREHITGNIGEIKLGTWIMYNSIDHGWMRGYVEQMPQDANRERIQIRFFEADNQELFSSNEYYARRGYLLYVPVDECSLIPEESYRMEEGYIRNMIDLALTAKDEELFIELTHSLLYIQSQRS